MDKYFEQMQHQRLVAAIEAQGVTLEDLPAALADLQRKCQLAAEDNKRITQTSQTAS